MVQELIDFLDGDTDAIVKRLNREMRAAADEQEYERAARVRDRLSAVHKAIAKQQMVAERNEDLDVIGIAQDELEAAVQVFYVRRGRVVGRKGFILDKVEDLDDHGLAARILEEMYGDEPPLGVPKQVLVPVEPEARDVYEEWLAIQRRSRVEVRVPQRGDKRALLDTVTRNAKEEFTRHRLRRASDHNSRARAINELQDLLGLPEAPLRIECYDMAHLQGTDYVGSMVVMEDGLPKKSDYRRFKVKGVEGNDDYAAMEEVLTRRLTAYLAERDRPVGERGERPGRFSYPPQLLLVDGGKGQLAVAERVVRDLGLDDEIPVASLAKRFEEVYVPGRADPVNVPRQSEALFMLQRLRDEAHRFANTFHRDLRGKRMTTSALDGIPGLGADPPEAAAEGAGRGGRCPQGQLGRAESSGLAARPRSPRPSTPSSMPNGARRTDRADEPEGHRPRPTSGRPTRPGGSRASPRVPTPSTRSRSCPWPPSTWPALGECSTSAAERASSPGWPTRSGPTLVVGVDPTWNQIRVAAERGGGPHYGRAGAAALPFAAGAFDAVVACLVFEHIREVDAAIAEVARVLQPGGRFLFFLNHPLLQTPDSGWIDDQILDPPEQYWRIGAYLSEDERLEEVEKDVFIPFIHRPLSRYVNTLAANGLHVVHMAEPAPPPGFLARAPEYPAADTIPRLLLLHTRKRP